jgi:hypothetical protein
LHDLHEQHATYLKQLDLESKFADSGTGWDVRARIRQDLAKIEKKIKEVEEQESQLMALDYDREAQATVCSQAEKELAQFDDTKEFKTFRKRLGEWERERTRQRTEMERLQLYQQILQGP